jgi:ankyrin repeat protein
VRVMDLEHVRERALIKAAELELVLEVESGEAARAIPLWRQGNVGLYSNRSQLERQRAVRSAQLNPEVEKFWAVVAGGGDRINKEDFTFMVMKMYRCLVRPFVLREAVEAAAADWAHDCRGRDWMVFSEFRESLALLADTWTNTTHVRDYVDFLRTLHRRTMTINSQGRIGWRADNKIVWFDVDEGAAGEHEAVLEEAMGKYLDIFEAIVAGDALAVESFIRRSTDVNEARDGGVKPLHVAAQTSFVRIAKLLLVAGADPRARIQKGGLTALHLATLHGDADMVAVLAGMGTTDTDDEGKTALHYACELADLTLVKVLIATKSNPNARDKGGETPLHCVAGADPQREPAVRAPDSGAVLSPEQVAEWNQRLNNNTNQKPPDAEAIVWSDDDDDDDDEKKESPKETAVETAVETTTVDPPAPAPAPEPSPEQPEPTKPLEPLVIVSTKEQIEGIVSLLFRSGGFLDSRTEVSKATPMHYAARVDNVYGAASLLNYKAKADFEDSNGKTPLDVARISDAHRVVKLLEENMELLAKNHQGIGPDEALSRMPSLPKAIFARLDTVSSIRPPEEPAKPKLQPLMGLDGKAAVDSGPAYSAAALAEKVRAAMPAPPPKELPDHKPKSLGYLETPIGSRPDRVLGNTTTTTTTTTTATATAPTPQSPKLDEEDDEPPKPLYVPQHERNKVTPEQEEALQLSFEREVWAAVEAGDGVKLRLLTGQKAPTLAQSRQPQRRMNIHSDLLLLALALNRPDLALVLLATKWPVLEIDKVFEGSTLLRMAVRMQNMALVAALLQAGADPVAGSEEGRSALHDAAELNYVEPCRALIAATTERGLNLNARDDKGYTPLHLAAYEGHLTPVLDLLAAGAVRDPETNRGETPLHFATWNRHKAVRRALLPEGEGSKEAIDDDITAALAMKAAADALLGAAKVEQKKEEEGEEVVVEEQRQVVVAAGPEAPKAPQEEAKPEHKAEQQPKAELPKAELPKVVQPKEEEQPKAVEQPKVELKVARKEPKPEPEPETDDTNTNLQPTNLQPTLPTTSTKAAARPLRFKEPATTTPPAVEAPEKQQPPAAAAAAATRPDMSFVVPIEPELPEPVPASRFAALPAVADLPPSAPPPRIHQVSSVASPPPRPHLQPKPQPPPSTAEPSLEADVTPSDPRKKQVRLVQPRPRAERPVAAGHQPQPPPPPTPQPAHPPAPPAASRPIGHLFPDSTEIAPSQPHPPQLPAPEFPGVRSIVRKKEEQDSPRVEYRMDDPGHARERQRGADYFSSGFKEEGALSELKLPPAPPQPPPPEPQPAPQPAPSPPLPSSRKAAALAIMKSSDVPLQVRVDASLGLLDFDPRGGGGRASPVRGVAPRPASQQAQMQRTGPIHVASKRGFVSPFAKVPRLPKIDARPNFAAQGQGQSSPETLLAPIPESRRRRAIAADDFYPADLPEPHVYPKLLVDGASPFKNHPLHQQPNQPNQHASEDHDQGPHEAPPEPGIYFTDDAPSHGRYVGWAHGPRLSYGGGYFTSSIQVDKVFQKLSNGFESETLMSMLPLEPPPDLWANNPDVLDKALAAVMEDYRSRRPTTRHLVSRHHESFKNHPENEELLREKAFAPAPLGVTTVPPTFHFSQKKL